MKNGFLIHSAPKNHTNKLKWRVASAVLAGIALLFAFQGFTRADDDDHNDATPIADCSVTFMINNPGRYFLANDLKQCPSIGISINVSDVKLELRGHTIQGTSPASTIILVNGGTAGISNIEIAGPGTVTGGAAAGIELDYVQHSRVHNLVVVGNGVAGGPADGIDVFAGDRTTPLTTAATASTDNEFRDNVVTGNSGFGIQVDGGNGNSFIHNNLSGNALDGLFLRTADNNVVRQNTIDSNGSIGIEVGTGSGTASGNMIEGNTALGNAVDLLDSNGCPSPNTWTHNSFFSSNPATPSCIQ
jgi:parallel beta-helix repeat protein